MTSHGAKRWAGVLAVVLGVGLLIPSSASAQAIRILLIMPSESGKLSRHVARFDEALAMSRGPLVRAANLAEADAVVEFTEYRRAVDEKGDTEDWWTGQFRLLTPPARDARLAPAVPERFKLLVIGRISRDVEPAIELLGKLLARALGREPRPARDGSV
jgi:hypothetical protein